MNNFSLFNIFKYLKRVISVEVCREYVWFIENDLAIAKFQAITIYRAGFWVKN